GEAMPEERPPSPDELARQLRLHAASLRAAGVEWLPTAPPPVPKPAPPPVTQSASPAGSVSAVSSLFDAHESIGPKASSGASPEQRRQELTVLAGQVAQCTRCAELAATRTQTVFGEGALDAALCFIGEAPGADEDATGRPFVGAAGKLLD